MGVKLDIKSNIAAAGFAGITKRELNKVLKDAWEAAGKFWHQWYRPRHFTVRAYSLYGATARASGYVKRKRKKLGHNRPLVFTGVSEDLSRARTVRASFRGVNVSMSMPTLNFRPKGGRINMREEMAVIADEEMATIERRYDNGLTRELNRLGARPARARDASGRFI